MKNFRLETLDVLAAHNKGPNDVIWVGTKQFEIPIDEFWKLADIQYDEGYGAAEIAGDLIVAGADWWLERREYDGAEWWAFVMKPDRPWRKERVSTLKPNYHNGEWELSDCIVEEEEDEG